MLVYFNGKFISHEEVKVSPFDRSFLFSDGVYEALRTYNGKLFRLDDHIKRLKYCLKELDLAFNDCDLIKHISYKLAEMNNIKNNRVVPAALQPADHVVSLSRLLLFPQYWL